MFGISSGFDTKNIIVVNGSPKISSPASSRDVKSKSMLAAEAADSTTSSSSEENVDYITINVDDLLS